MNPAAIDRLCERLLKLTGYGSHAARLVAEVKAALAGEMDRSEALRLLHLTGDSCNLCGAEFYAGEPEDHEPGCLAAPETP